MGIIHFMKERGVVPQELNFLFENIHDAEGLIIGGAKDWVVRLDWDFFELSREQVAESFDLLYPSFLRSPEAPEIVIPLSVLDERRLAEYVQLSRLPPYWKKELEQSRGQWLVMRNRIGPELGTVMRDWMCAKMPGVIAQSRGICRSPAGLELVYLTLHPKGNVAWTEMMARIYRNLEKMGFSR